MIRIIACIKINRQMSFASSRDCSLKLKTSDSFHPFPQIQYAKPLTLNRHLPTRKTFRVSDTYTSKLYGAKTTEISRFPKLDSRALVSSHSIPRYSLRDPVQMTKFRDYQKKIYEMDPCSFCYYRKNETSDIFNSRPSTSLVQFNYLCSNLF